MQSGKSVFLDLIGYLLGEDNVSNVALQDLEENRYRAATCDECRGFVKMTFTLGPLSEVELLVTDLATLHLDLAAGDRGFLVR